MKTPSFFVRTKREIPWTPFGKSFVLTLVSMLLGFSSCTSRSTDSTEVGVRTKKLFGAGIEPTIYQPGGTYFFFPFLSDWHTFDIKLQNLEMIRDPSRGDDEAIEFKTVDGNDISVNATIAWRIDPQKAPQLLSRVGHSTNEIKERLIRPTCRAVVRDVLNALHSEEFYISEKRFQKADESRKRLQQELESEGIIIEQVLFGEHRFNPNYEKVIHDRKIAEQNAERIKSEALAAAAEQARNLESARGDVQVSVAQAKGQAEQIAIATDKKYYESEREAKAILAESTARAKGIIEQNKAMAGAGGRTAIKIKVAEALKGKPIVVIPSGSGANLQKLDINRLVETFVAQEAGTSQEPSAQ